MKNILLLLLICLITACSGFVAGNIKKERKELYEYNNDQKYCNENPERCVNNIPW